MVRHNDANPFSIDGEWVRIIVPNSESGELGWISTQLISTSGDFSTLHVVQPGQPQFGPMQAFYLTTGIGDAGCNEAPESGVLIQTPEGVSEVTFNINGVDVAMGSTVLFQAQPDAAMS